MQRLRLWSTQLLVYVGFRFLYRYLIHREPLTWAPLPGYLTSGATFVAAFALLAWWQERRDRR